jgi:hypothetical protein
MWVCHRDSVDWPVHGLEGVVVSYGLDREFDVFGRNRLTIMENGIFSKM